MNLYGFCRNNSINLWDYLGMEPGPGFDPTHHDQVAVVTVDGTSVTYVAVDLNFGTESEPDLIWVPQSPIQLPTFEVRDDPLPTDPLIDVIGDAPNSAGTLAQTHGPGFGQLPSQVIPGSGANGGPTQMTPFVVNETIPESGNLPPEIVAGFREVAPALNTGANLDRVAVYGAVAPFVGPAVMAGGSTGAAVVMTAGREAGRIAAFRIGLPLVGSAGATLATRAPGQAIQLVLRGPELLTRQGMLRVEALRRAAEAAAQASRNRLQPILPPTP